MSKIEKPSRPGTGSLRAGMLSLGAFVVATAVIAGAAFSLVSTSEGKLATTLRTDSADASATRILAENSLWTAMDGTALFAGLHMGATVWSVKGALPVDPKVVANTGEALMAASKEGKLFGVSQVVHLKDPSVSSAAIQQARLKSATCGCAVEEAGVGVKPVAVSIASVKASRPTAREFTEPGRSQFLATGLAITGLFLGMAMAFIRWSAAPLGAALLFLTLPLVYKAGSGLMWTYLGHLVLHSLVTS